jgi:hypothetical protein
LRHGLLGVLHLLQDRQRVLIEDLAGIGGNHALGRAVQQLRRHLVFQLADLLGQRRLGDVQHPCRPRERTVIDDGHEVAQLA